LPEVRGGVEGAATVLSAAAGCPASSGVPAPRGYVAGQSGVLSSVLMSPFLMLLLLDAGADCIQAENVAIFMQVTAGQPAAPLAGW